MTVDSRYQIVPYVRDDEVTYRFLTESIGESAIQVWVIRASDNFRYQLALNTDYTVTFDDNRSPIYKGGTVILNQPLNEEIATLSLERKTPIVNDFEAVGLQRFESEQFEFIMDKICFIQQEIEGHFCDCRGECIPVFITSQPTNQPSGGGTATFTVIASGSPPITYQWQESADQAGPFVDMVGETNPSLTVADTSTQWYRVIVTNDCGAAISDVVMVDIPYTCDAVYTSLRTEMTPDSWYWPGTDGVLTSPTRIPGDGSTIDIFNLQPGVTTANNGLLDECVGVGDLAIAVNNAIGVINDTALPYDSRILPSGEQEGHIFMFGITDHNTGSAENQFMYANITGSDNPGSFGEIFVAADNDKIYFFMQAGNLGGLDQLPTITFATMGVSRPDVFFWAVDFSWDIENRLAGEDGIGVAHSRSVVTVTLYAGTRTSGLFSSTGTGAIDSGNTSPTKGLTPDPTKTFHDWLFGGVDDKMEWNHYAFGALVDTDRAAAIQRLYDQFLLNFSS